MGVERGIIVTAPSGSGKTTIVRYLLSRFSQLAFSVSATTRTRRDDEVDGRDYHFLSAREFQSRLDAGGFVEYEEVYPGKLYGTLQSEVERHTAAGKVVVFDVDVKGALRLKDHFGEMGLSLFVRPPAFEVLSERLKARGSESPESLEQRLTRAADELTYASRFDAIIINDDLQQAFSMAEDVVRRWLYATS